MIYRDFEQRSPEWFRRHLGCVSSSRLGDVCKKRRDMAESAGRAHLRSQLLAEMLSGMLSRKDLTGIPDVENGKECEPLAQCCYEIRTGYLVVPIGLAEHPSIPRFLASTDGLVGDSGMVEIKCLKRENHIETVEAFKKCQAPLLIDYRLQCFGGMSCAERDWCDLVFYNPEIRQPLDLYIHRIERDDKLINGIETEVRQFLFELDGAYKFLTDDGVVEEKREYENQSA
jgi:hypothetical protein